MRHFSPLSIALLFALALIILTGLVWTGNTETFDHSWHQTALDVDPPQLLGVWKGITFLGSVLVITTLTITILLALALFQQWLGFRYIGLVMLIAVVIENGMKWIVHRARPNEVIDYAMPTSFSFPSGHALFATAFYGSIAIILSAKLTSWARILAWVTLATLVLAIGASRVFLGVHYPSDVIAGFLAGAFCISAAQLMKRFVKIFPQQI
jgi:undecaprenyl-diphosphatase